jgi:GxxExxY protein
MGKLLEEELCYKIRGCVFDVANKYGKGLKENIYQNALAEEFNLKNLKFKEQKRIDIFSIETGKKLGTYVPDFVIEDKVIMELKASIFTTKNDVDQQRSYLRASTYEIGYLVNFCTPKLEISRSICTNDRKPFITKLTINNP